MLCLKYDHKEALWLAQPTWVKQKAQELYIVTYIRALQGDPTSQPSIQHSMNSRSPLHLYQYFILPSQLILFHLQFFNLMPPPSMNLSRSPLSPLVLSYAPSLLPTVLHFYYLYTFYISPACKLAKQLSGARKKCLTSNVLWLSNNDSIQYPGVWPEPLPLPSSQSLDTMLTNFKKLTCMLITRSLLWRKETLVNTAKCFGLF